MNINILYESNFLQIYVSFQNIIYFILVYFFRLII